MIISIDKRMEDVDSGSAMFLNWNAMNPLKRKAIGRKMLIGAESAIFPMTGRANKVPIIAPVSTSLYSVFTRSSDSILPDSTKLVIQSMR